jgi:hypothetical protein
MHPALLLAAAVAGGVSTADLREWCQVGPDRLGENASVADVMSASLCAGYLGGAREMGQIVSEAPGASKMFCIPADVTNDHLRLAFLKALEDQPESAHHPAVVNLLVTLRLEFPCE